MLPPTLEVYLVWHPDDARALDSVKALLKHFHGSPYDALMGNAIEVYVRFAPWRRGSSEPRPIPLPGAEPPDGIEPSPFVAVVPVFGCGLARAVNAGDGWRGYLQGIAESRSRAPDRIGIYPIVLDPDAAFLGAFFGNPQAIGQIDRTTPPDLVEPWCERICRDLAQSLAQFLRMPGDPERLRVFLSHTKWDDSGEEVGKLVELVRRIVGRTRLEEFFDSSSLQGGSDWVLDLEAAAAQGAMLSVRTDLYATREWCHREVRTAKRAGVPLVVLNALTRGEQRGSFLLDHVSCVPARYDGGSWRADEVRRALNMLVDECLKRALWCRQQQIIESAGAMDVSWWAPHAPEPTTLVQWIEAHRAAAGKGRKKSVRVLYPDPPLGPVEMEELKSLAALAGVAGFDAFTPRMLAARGG